MSNINCRKKNGFRAQFEVCEPRQLMTAQAATSPEFHVDYFVSAPTSQVSTQGAAAAPGTEAYYQAAPDEVRAAYGLTGAGQTVAVIDTGMAYDDAALGGGFGSGYRVVGGWDFAENDADPYDDGPAGSHGTHVAGIIGSDDPSNLGVAPGVDLVSLRVFDDAGAGYFSLIDNALRWVYDNRSSFRNPITTVNLSLGTSWNSASLPAYATLENDFRMLTQVGIFISVAAGNGFADYGTPGLSYPAASPYVVPVMSSGASETLSAFSQRLDRAIAAPGENITSTVPDYAGDHNGVDDDWASYSGTSMAAAYMSGAAVIVRQALQQAGRTNIDENAIYQIMRKTADQTFDAATNASYLVLNLKNAVDAALHTPVDREGNTAATALDTGSLDLKNTVSGTIDSNADVDFFRFTAQHTGKVSINISRGQAMTTRWQLVNANGTLRTVTGNVITLQVTAGKTYAFGVKALAGSGDYDLSFQLTPAVTGLGMLGNRTVSNQRVSGEKWYRFQAAHAGTLALTSRIPSGTANITMQVYNSAMQLIGVSTGESTDLLNMAAAQGSVYFVRLVGANTKVQLQVACAAASKVPKSAAGIGKAATASFWDANSQNQTAAPSASGETTAIAAVDSAAPTAPDNRAFVWQSNANGAAFAEDELRDQTHRRDEVFAWDYVESSELLPGAKTTGSFHRQIEHLNLAFDVASLGNQLSVV